MNVKEIGTCMTSRGNVALLEKMEAGSEKYIVARDYEPMTREWFGGGSYFCIRSEAVTAYLDLIAKWEGLNDED